MGNMDTETVNGKTLGCRREHTTERRTVPGNPEEKTTRYQTGDGVNTQCPENKVPRRRKHKSEDRAITAKKQGRAATPNPTSTTGKGKDENRTLIAPTMEAGDMDNSTKIGKKTRQGEKDAVQRLGTTLRTGLALCHAYAKWTRDTRDTEGNRGYNRVRAITSATSTAYTLHATRGETVYSAIFHRLQTQDKSP